MQYNYYANDDHDKLQKFDNENFLNLQVNWFKLVDFMHYRLQGRDKRII